MRGYTNTPSKGLGLTTHLYVQIPQDQMTFAERLEENVKQRSPPENPVELDARLTNVLGLKRRDFGWNRSVLDSP